MKKYKLFLPTIAIYLLIISCNLPEKSYSNDLPQQKWTQHGVPFSKVPDPRDVTIYQINIRAFSDEGNFKG
jgi:hypothetical protein